MQRYRSLRSSTAAVMGTAYVAHAALTGGTLAMQWAPLPIRPAVARVAGAALIVGGSGLCVAGVCRFGGAGELAGHKALHPEWSRVYTAGAGNVKPGFVLKQPDLARTLEALAEKHNFELTLLPVDHPGQEQ